MATAPFWLDGPLPPVPAGGATGAVDAVVVGGGVTGCACALALARGGLAVRVLEAGEVASGASGRNGGFALRGLCPPYDDARAKLGAEAARALWLLTEEALERMALLAGDALRRVGSLRLALDAPERDAIRREFEALRADGLAVEWVDPLPEPLARRFAAGFVHPGDAALSPALWVHRLAGHAAAAGVRFVEHHPVDRAALDRLDADVVVVAVDGLTHALAPELAEFVRPVRGQALATEPLPELLYPRPHYARGGYDYWQQLPDGRLILGGRRDRSAGTEQTAVDATTPVIQAELDALVEELLGHRPVITHRWSGIWGQTADLLPLAGRVPGSERLWVAGGYSGHGNVLGFACGELVARSILGEPAPELAWFDPARALVGSTALPASPVAATRTDAGRIRDLPRSRREEGEGAAPESA